MKINNNIISHNSKTYIIAEIGINHNGELNKALELIDVAKNSGADAVKFQKRTPKIAIPKSQWKTKKIRAGISNPDPADFNNTPKCPIIKQNVLARGAPSSSRSESGIDAAGGGGAL